VLDRRAGSVLVRRADHSRHALVTGRASIVDGVEVLVAVREKPTAPGARSTIAELATMLADAESPEQAMRVLLEWTLRWAEADGGAIVAREAGGYQVIAAHGSTGIPLADAAALLSDTLVRDVLESANPIRLDDGAVGARYAQVHSVANLKLRALACVPMPLGHEVVGALLVGRRDVRRPLPAALVTELAVIAAMASPLVVQLRRHSAAPSGAALVGDSAAMRDVRRTIEKLAPYDLSVLVSGPSGSGKELVARALHMQSPRAAGPLVAMSCAAVPPSLLEAELFGYCKGAFTGATTDRAGKLEAANGGTLFLDEIGDCPLPMQAALLRAVQEREIVRIGDTIARRVDFRLVTATHKHLPMEVAQGRFREDLMFRIREVEVALPPLAARDGDIALLARLFLKQAEHELRLPPRRLTADALATLETHPWPGNVRELRAVMRRAAVMADREEVTAHDLALDGQPRRAPAAPSSGDRRPLAEARDAFVTQYVTAALDRCGGDRTAAATELGISVRSLYRYLGEQ
jgi:DNA-binding NtrC family response regulator